jgi:hypothetical protein
VRTTLPCHHTLTVASTRPAVVRPQKNHLGQRHKLINASRHPITVGVDKTAVYGMWFDPGFGYHVDNTTGIATGNDPESIYAVMSGKNFNGECCFDYGNSETDDRDDGCGTMEAICESALHVVVRALLHPRPVRVHASTSPSSAWGAP